MFGIFSASRGCVGTASTVERSLIKDGIIAFNTIYSANLCAICKLRAAGGQLSTNSFGPTAAAAAAAVVNSIYMLPSNVAVAFSETFCK
jgi:hypothetical protein